MNHRRTYLRLFSAALALLTIALIATACGSSSKKEDKPTSAEKAPATTETAATTDTATTAGGGGVSGTCKGTKANDQQYAAEPPMTVKATDNLTATLTTSEGDIVIKLLPKTAPHAVNNFVFLARKNFYHCVLFHRIIKDFMVQTGDPEGTGQGGPGYEIAADPTTEQYTKGIVAMANTGTPDTGGSQFFIVQGDSAPLSPPAYPVFGKVTKGLDVLDKLAAVEVTGPENSSPVTPVYLKDVKISG